MTREEHVAWCRQRALAELDAGGPAAVTNALASLTSDLRKHPETEAHQAILLGMELALHGHLRTEQQMREWIEGVW